MVKAMEVHENFGMSFKSHLEIMGGGELTKKDLQVSGVGVKGRPSIKLPIK